MKQKYYYMVVNRNINPITINSQLPIYWLRKEAEEQAKRFKAHGVIKVTIGT